MKRSFRISVWAFVISILASLCGIASNAFAGPLDIWYWGVPNNPDRYISVDLLATYGHDIGTNTFSLVSPDIQNSQANSRGLKGQLRIPIDANSTFLLGGGWSTGDFTYTPTPTLIGEDGTIKSFNVEAGFRFYIHD